MDNAEIGAVNFKVDVEYVEDKPVLHKWTDIRIRVKQGFDWADGKQTRALVVS